MSLQYRLITDADFEEALQRGFRVRVFQDNHIVDASSIILRFDDNTVVTQSSVSDLSYHNRKNCEFFQLKKK